MFATRAIGGERGLRNNLAVARNSYSEGRISSYQDKGPQRKVIPPFSLLPLRLTAGWFQAA
eukprot:240886-Pelagomonas_calceolata.AAC.1